MKNTYKDKIRFRRNGTASGFLWEVYDQKTGWVVKGAVENAILQRCKFDGAQPTDSNPEYIYCDYFYDAGAPMVKTVTMFGQPIRTARSEFQCDSTPIRSCDQAIIMNNSIYRIA